MKMPQNELPLYIHWIKTLKYILNKTEKFPKKIRFTFTTRIDNLTLEILEKIVEAQYTSDKEELLKTINVNLEKLRVIFGICNELGYLENKGYEYASRLIDEAGRMTGGWLKEVLQR